MISTCTPVPNGTHDWSLPVLLFQMEPINDRYLYSCSEWNTLMITTCSPVPNGTHEWSLIVLLFRMEHIIYYYLFSCSEWRKLMIATCSPVPNGTHEWSLPPMIESPSGPPARDKHTSSIILVFVTLCTLI